MRNCGKRTFENIDQTRIDAILKGLTDNGSTITGMNPWDADTRNHGVRLLGEWDENASILSITVIDADWYVPQSKIWESIESLMQIVQGKT